ncbi:MAG: DNA cytosine methyltransferase [Bacteroidales bacterium]
MKNSFITVTDQFCGAGGSSQGVRRISEKNHGGLEVKLAMNHWKLAIETHNTNFPDTVHDCTDISAADPRRYHSTDILITSPECTNHSLAKGVKRAKAQIDLFNCGLLDPAADRSRATMWDVPRFAEYHNYNLIIVENVVDAREWIMFDAWLQAMHLLGYKHKCVYLNSMFCHPTPQSRDRMYIVFWKKGNREPMLDFRPAAHCPSCNIEIKAVQRWKNPSKQFGKFRKQYNYVCPVCASEVMPYFYAAFNCIDWSDIGTRIGDRAKPLAENTIRRIEYGLKKYGKQSLIIHAGYSNKARGTERSLMEPAFTQTSFESQALVHPFIINNQQSTGLGFRVRGVDEMLPTIATGHQLNLVMPFILKEEYTHDLTSLRDTMESLTTQTTRQSMALVIPSIVEMNSSGNLRPADQAMATVLAGGNHHGLLSFMVELKKQSTVRGTMDPLSCITSNPYHGVVSSEAWSSFISYFYGQAQASGMDESLGTVSTKDRFAMVNFQEPKIEDCYFRMLRPHEIKLAMAFDRQYIVLGSQKDQVKQLGNAVTPPAMEWLVERGIESLS